MRLRQRIDTFRQFVKRYAADGLIKALEAWIRDVIENANSGTRIILAVLLIPALLLVIGLLKIGIALKWLVLVFFELMKMLFKMAIEEADFYLKKTGEIGKVLAQDLAALLDRLFALITSLSQEIGTDPNNPTDQPLATAATPQSAKVAQPGLVTAFHFLKWIVLAIITTIMSILLVLTFFTGSPLAHRYSRMFFAGTKKTEVSSQP